MNGAKLLTSLVLLLFVSVLDLASTETDPLDVAAINTLFRAMNSPQQLTGWTSEGGDPCGGEPWHGVVCSGKSIISININGLGVGGQLSSNLSGFMNLQELDISKNSFGGQIPEYLPPNATYIDMACNMFNMNMPFSFSYLTSLTYLNLSHNSLFGHIGNIFTDLHNLQNLDLSFNHFSGDLPSSFASLTNLHGLYLQENHFTGSVAYLADLPLTSLNIENNHFSGVVPRQFESIRELKINGNMFNGGYAVTPPRGAEYSPPRSPRRPPPSVFSSTRRGCDGSKGLASSLSCRGDYPLDRGVPSWGIAAGVVGSVAFMGLILTVIYVFGRRLRRVTAKSSQGPCDSDADHPVMSVDSSIVSASRTAPSNQTRSSRVSKRKFSLRKLRGLPTAKPYSASDLLLATNNFDGKNFLGDSAFGPSYRADFPGGQACVVWRLDMGPLSQREEEMFMRCVWNASRLKHPHIVRLLGYCVEKGERMLVYEYAKSWSLEWVLHSRDETRKLLSWRARVKIAVGVARALEYLHWTSAPPMPHGNLTGASVLLDERMFPRLGDCGLAALRSIGNLAAPRTGYSAPEFGVSGEDKTKSDVFSFGVLLLELLTGRRPSDTSMGREEESLAKWASSRLHDIGMLEDMTDPAIKSGVTAHGLSRFADIVLPCIQPHPEFRPVINEVGDQLGRLLGKMHRGAETDASEVSSLRAALSPLDLFSRASACENVPSSSAPS